MEVEKKQLNEENNPTFHLKLSVEIYKDTFFNIPPLKGFTNHENCCYINCSIQLLMNLSLFPQHHQPQNQVTQYLHNLQRRYQSEPSPIDIKQFRDIINQTNHAHHYQHNVIYDALEFLIHTIDSLDETLRNQFIAIDEGNIQMQTLVVPVTELEGKMCVDEYIKGVQLSVYPHFLLVQISRGKQDGFKSHDPIYYNQLFLWNQTPYQLKGILNHRGFEKDGHYNIKIRTEKGYYLADESTVTQRSLETRSRNVVAILYERIQ